MSLQYKIVGKRYSSRTVVCSEVCMHLFGERGGVGADAEVRLCAVTVDVLKAVAVFVHDETRGVVKQNADAVVTQLIT